MKKSKVKSQNLEQKAKIRNPNFLSLFVLFLILAFSGCATAPYVQSPGSIKVQGTYHKVEKGQTLWRISKIYGVDLDELARVNHISDASSIEINQLILIPNASKPRSVPADYSGDDFIWPLRGRVISTFGQTYRNMINKGLNIQPTGEHDIIASRKGKVVFVAQDLGGFGKTIIIEHNDGYSTVYSRNQEVYVKPGEEVTKGMRIARAGYAGRDKNTYLHFEVRKGTEPKNPYYYLP